MQEQQNCTRNRVDNNQLNYPRPIEFSILKFEQIALNLYFAILQNLNEIHAYKMVFNKNIFTIHFNFEVST